MVDGVLGSIAVPLAIEGLRGLRGLRSFPSPRKGLCQAKQLSKCMAIHCWYLPGIQSFQGFLGGAGFRPPQQNKTSHGEFSRPQWHSQTLLWYAQTFSPFDRPKLSLFYSNVNRSLFLTGSSAALQYELCAISGIWKMLVSPRTSKLFRLLHKATPLATCSLGDPSTRGRVMIARAAFLLAALCASLLQAAVGDCVGGSCEAARSSVPAKYSLRPPNDHG